MIPDPEGLARFDQAMVGVEMAGGILTDPPIGPMTTYRAGGSAARFVRPVDRSELEAVAAGVASAGIPVLVVGRGSNLLVADAGFGGLALQLGQAFEKVRADETTVVAGAGVSLPVLARWPVAHSLPGVAGAVGVPGAKDPAPLGTRPGELGPRPVLRARARSAKTPGGFYSLPRGRRNREA